MLHSVWILAIREMIQAKVETRAPEVVVAEGKPETAVIKIIDALKERCRRTRQGARCRAAADGQVFAQGESTSTVSGWSRRCASTLQ